MHHPTYGITHTTAFVTPVVEHWLEGEIAHEGLTTSWATLKSFSCVLTRKRTLGYLLIVAQCAKRGLKKVAICTVDSGVVIKSVSAGGGWGVGHAATPDFN